MSERIIATGIESSFIESYTGWDEMEVMSIIFYGAKFKEGFDLPTDKEYTVGLDLNASTLEVYSDNEGEGEDGVLFKRSVTLNILPA